MLFIFPVLYLIRLQTQNLAAGVMQFGFMKGKGTTDAIFVVTQMQDNFRAKDKKLHFGCVDLEKLLIGFQEK